MRFTYDDLLLRVHGYHGSCDIIYSPYRARGRVSSKIQVQHILFDHNDVSGGAIMSDVLINGRNLN